VSGGGLRRGSSNKRDLNDHDVVYAFCIADGLVLYCSQTTNVLKKSMDVLSRRMLSGLKVRPALTAISCYSHY